MATSGTIGATLVPTVSIVERAIRRCGLPPTSITAETVSIALEDLFSLLMSVSSRGLNLWCVDKMLMPLVRGQAVYTLPPGTLEVLNLIHATPSRVEGTNTSGATFFQTEFAEAVTIVRVGVKFSAVQAFPFSIQSSGDGISWTTHVQGLLSPVAGEWTWYDIDPAADAAFFRLSSPTLSTVSDFYLATNVREIPVSKFNRDDYSNQPAKTFQSLIVTNYYFEKLVTPRITLWPVPSDDTRHLVLFRYRQIQDVGELTNELELPLRWIEAIIWQLALRLAFELPGVEAARRAEIVQVTQGMTLEVENTETDNAPIQIHPNIGVYTR